LTCPVTPSALGAYVLGALDPEERSRFEEHLDGCPLCAAELAEFAGIPGLLDRVRPEDLQPVAVAPSHDLFDRVSAAAGVQPEPPPRRLRWLLVAAAVLALFGAGAGAVVWATSQDGGPVTATAGPVEATLVADGEGEGTVLDISVAGLRPGETCRLVAVDADGGHHDAGEWPVSDDGDGQWRGWTEVDPGALREVVLYGDGDRELVRISL
jgi:Putative zinc-finger